MNKEDLLSQFTAKVDELARYQGFISKAKAQAGKFKASVVEKVVLSNTEKSLVVVDEISPLINDVEQFIADLREEKEQIIGGQRGVREQLEELELRLAIGELTQEAFDAQAIDLRESLEETETRIAAIENDLERFGSVLEQWHEESTKAGLITETPDAYEDEAFGGEDDAAGVHVEHVSVRDDMSDVFDEPIESPADSSESLESFDVLEAGGADDDAISVGGIDDLIAVGGEDDLLAAGDDLDMLADDADTSSTPAGVPMGGPKQAVLIYQEGTSDEEVYKLEGEFLSLGRGRDNDIQVKNDSKVSRYHCKIYRRGDQYIIEDNKSANGSLVNGELVTERQLFGGEEIIIGETFFRFKLI